MAATAALRCGTSGANPFLHARQMEAGTMQRGYIISAAKGITLGPTAANSQGFRFIPLTRIDPAKPYDWQQASGCVSVTGGGVTKPGPAVCGEVLIDTGVDRMFLTYASGFPAFVPGRQTGPWTGAAMPIRLPRPRAGPSSPARADCCRAPADGLRIPDNLPLISAGLVVGGEAPSRVVVELLHDRRSA